MDAGDRKKSAHVCIPLTKIEEDVGPMILPRSINVSSLFWLLSRFLLKCR